MAVNFAPRNAGRIWRLLGRVALIRAIGVDTIGVGDVEEVVTGEEVAVVDMVEVVEAVVQEEEEVTMQRGRDLCMFSRFGRERSIFRSSCTFALPPVGSTWLLYLLYLYLRCENFMTEK